jgi:plasmid stabilization system protein ParE
MAKPRIVWFDEAVRDLESIADYLATNRGLPIALIFIERIQQSVALLQSFPEIGPPRTFGYHEGRILVPRRFSHYLIFYRYDATSGDVQITRILKARDLSLLR